MRSRRLSYVAGIVALAAMPLAQTAFALTSCNLYRTQSHAVMIAAQDAEGDACHESGDNANLCLAHCQRGDQTLDRHQVKVPESFLQPVLVIRARQGSGQPVLVPRRLPAPAAGPPPRILFQSLLI
jgi:hypothetical protein